VEQLRPLGEIFPEATGGFLSKLAWQIWQLEVTGATHFGGPDVLAHWLVQRCQPKAPMTKAKIRQLQRMCGGSQKTIDLLQAMAEEHSRPRRLDCGWSFLELCSYMTRIRAERGVANFGG
jgi:hypothetical protein